MIPVYDFGKRRKPCGDCDERGHCTMNCGPCIDNKKLAEEAEKHKASVSHKGKFASAARIRHPSRTRPFRLRIETDCGTDEWTVTEYSSDGATELYRGSHAEACAVAKRRVMNPCGND